MRQILKFLCALAFIGSTHAADTKTPVSTEATQNVAQEVSIGSLTLKNYWVRKPSGGPNTAAYVTIDNTGDASDQLLSATCDTSIAQSVELHDHIMENGVAKMRPVEVIDVPAKGQATLAPGGKHIMLMKLGSGFDATKDTLTLTLVFKNAGSVTLAAPIKEAIKKQ